MEVRLVRSETNKVIAGVCGGLGIYLGIDPVLVRLAFLLLLFAGGVGLLIYLILMIAMPSESDASGPSGASGAKGSQDISDQPRQHPNGPIIAAGLLILLGIYLLLANLGIPFLGSPTLWALLLIGIGVYLIVQRRR